MIRKRIKYITLRFRKLPLADRIVITNLIQRNFLYLSFLKSFFGVSVSLLCYRLGYTELVITNKTAKYLRPG